MEKEKKIYVFADFLPFHNDLIGTIFLSQEKNYILLNMIRNGLKREPCY